MSAKFSECKSVGEVWMLLDAETKAQYVSYAIALTAAVSVLFVGIGVGANLALVAFCVVACMLWAFVSLSKATSRALKQIGPEIEAEFRKLIFQ